MALQFVLSEKGKPRLINDGYVFYKDKETDEKTYWKCSHFQKFKCPARISTTDDQISSQSKEHNHSGDAASLQASEYVNLMKEQAVKSLDSPHQIISKISEFVPSQIAPKLPTIPSMKKTIRYSRNKENELPPTSPNTAEELILPEDYKITFKKESFLLFDNKGEERILIFGTSQNVNILAQSKHWYV